MKRKVKYGIAVAIATLITCVFILPAATRISYDFGVMRIQGKEEIIVTVEHAMEHGEASVHFGIKEDDELNVEKWMKEIPGLTGVKLSFKKTRKGVNVVAKLEYWDCYPIIWSVENNEELHLDKRRRNMLEQYRNILLQLDIKNKTDYEKELAIHDYIVQNTEYDKRLNSGHPAWSLLNEGKGVCEGYAEAFYTLSKLAGLNVRIVTGETKGINHVWNQINIDNEWYHVDCTWDDFDGLLVHAWFNLTDEEMMKDHYWQRRDNYMAAGHKYSWVAQNDITDTMTGILKKARIALQQGKTGFEFIDEGDIDVSAVLSLLGQDVWFKNTEYERSGKVIHIICFRQDI